MGEGEVGATLRDTMMVVLKLGGPVLLAALAVGVIMSLVQAVTQINEATLAFVPKVVVRRNGGGRADVRCHARMAGALRCFGVADGRATNLVYDGAFERLIA